SMRVAAAVADAMEVDRDQRRTIEAAIERAHIVCGLHKNGGILRGAFEPLLHGDVLAAFPLARGRARWRLDHRDLLLADVAAALVRGLSGRRRGTLRRFAANESAFLGVEFEQQAHAAVCSVISSAGLNGSAPMRSNVSMNVSLG